VVPTRQASVARPAIEEPRPAPGRAEPASQRGRGRGVVKRGALRAGDENDADYPMPDLRFHAPP
jgi:hypothetical protein